MLTVHHLNLSRSHRIVWLCEELDLDYRLVKHQRDPVTLRAPGSLAKIHTLGRAPIIEHEGRTIIESEAVIEYVCNVLGNGRLSRDARSPEYSDYLQWLAFSEGTLMPWLAVDLIDAWTERQSPALMQFLEPELAKNHRWVEEALRGQEYLLKSGFSAADINLGWALEFSEARNRLAAFPALRRYLDRLRARIAYHRAIDRGGPQDLSVYSD